MKKFLLSTVIALMALLCLTGLRITSYKESREEREIFKAALWY